MKPQLAAIFLLIAAWIWLAPPTPANDERLAEYGRSARRVSRLRASLEREGLFDCHGQLLRARARQPAQQHSYGRLIWNPLPGFGVGAELLLGVQEDPGGTERDEERLFLAVQFGF